MPASFWNPCAASCHSVSEEKDWRPVQGLELSKAQVSYSLDGAKKVNESPVPALGMNARQRAPKNHKSYDVIAFSLF